MLSEQIPNLYILKKTLQSSPIEALGPAIGYLLFRPGRHESPVNRKQASQKRKNGEHDHFIHAKMILAAPL